MADIQVIVDATVPTNSTLLLTVSEDNSSNEDTITVNDGQNSYTVSGFTGVGSSYSIYYNATGPVDESVSVNSVELSTGTEISGTVTNAGTPIQGATVYVVDSTNGDLEGSATTDSNGDYSLTVGTGLVIDVVVQYDDGSDTFNTEANTYIQT